ncbi:MAG TPA: hypothetical protein VF230_16130 [Acidimicrobiales bacterium]
MPSITCIFRTALASVLVAAVLPWSPASAHGVDVCAGNGTVSTTEPLYYPKHVDVSLPPSVVDRPSASGRVAFAFGVGGCLQAATTAWPWLDSHPYTFEGEFSDGALTPPPLPGSPFGNYCGHSEGDLYLPGHRARWTSVGSLFVVAPSGAPDGAVGVLNVVPNEFAGDSCLAGARLFIFTGALVPFSDDVP